MSNSGTSSVDISDITEIKEQNWLQAILSNQAFWVTVVVILICVATAAEQESVATKNNFYNITRNFSPSTSRRSVSRSHAKRRPTKA